MSMLDRILQGVEMDLVKGIARELVTQARFKELHKAGEVSSGIVVVAPIAHIDSAEKDLDPDSLEALKAGGTLKHIITTKSKDRDGDVIHTDGWDFVNFEKNPVVLFGHNSRNLPVGRCLSLKQMKTKVVGTMEYPSADLYHFGNTVGRLAAAGYLKAVSVGFIPKEYELIDPDDYWGGFNFLKQELTEYSIVPVPANPEALSAALEEDARKDVALESFIRECADAVIEEVDSETVSSQWKSVFMSAFKKAIVVVEGKKEVDEAILTIVPDDPIVIIV
jgi:HK97 family phage prohead protease